MSTLAHVVGLGCNPLTHDPPFSSAQFPYPLLNKLPLAYGFFGFCVAGTSLVLFFFQVGAVARWSLRRRRLPAHPVPTKKTD